MSEQKSNIVVEELNPEQDTTETLTENEAQEFEEQTDEVESQSDFEVLQAVKFEPIEPVISEEEFAEDAEAAEEDDFADYEEEQDSESFSDQNTDSEAETSSDVAVAEVASSNDVSGGSTTTISRREYERQVRRANAERQIRRRENEEQRSAWAVMAKNMQRRTIMRGRVTGLVEMTMRTQANGEMRDVCLSVMLNNGYKAYMRFSEIYRDGEKALDERTTNSSSRAGRADILDRKRAMASKLMTVDIPVLITQMSLGSRNNYDDYLILVSRRQANLEIERANFGVTGRRKKPILEVDSIVDAQITSVAQNSLQVNVGGVDTTVPLRNLTYRYIPNASVFRSLYTVGEAIQVKITDIKVEGVVTVEYNERNRTVTREYPKHVIEVSAKRVEEENAKRKQGRTLTLKEQCIGTISTIPPAGRNRTQPTIYIWLEGYNMPAYATSVTESREGVPYLSGDTLRVRVEEFKKNGMTRVSIRGFEGPIPMHREKINTYEYR